MKVELHDIRLGHVSLSDRIYAGILTKDKTTWLQKTDVTDDFISAAIARWKGHVETLQDTNGRKYEISIKQII